MRDSPPDLAIGPEILRRQDVREKIVLLATGWGEKRGRADEWWFHSPHLSPDGARFLVENGARAVGIDHFSIGGATEPANAQTHDILLRSGLWIAEELAFPPAIFAVEMPFHFQALPLNLRGENGTQISGAPCRPVAMIG